MARKKVVLFDSNQVFALAKTFKELHQSDDMSDYEYGVVAGIEFIEFLTERMEK